MDNAKVLEMLEEERIDELKDMLQDEIYKDSIRSTPNANKRYAAMKRYFKYTDNARECLQKPYAYDYNGVKYNSFTNSWSLVLTKESTGEIEMFEGNYPDISRLIRFDGIKKKIDFNDVIAKAKSKGYRRTKGEVGPGFKYLMHYDGTYYKVGLIDISYEIINDGEPSITYHPDGERMPLTIENDIGISIIMPVFIHDKEALEEKVVIEID